MWLGRVAKWNAIVDSSGLSLGRGVVGRNVRVMGGRIRDALSLITDRKRREFGALRWWKGIRFRGEAFGVARARCMMVKVC